ncbi:Rid family detoxifying hydrolase [Candidatus Oleimmundimicrobium sp.]|uniref:Rid family detoxifying hydrolase n=1 Tax=Candidatus Oleimmundimicrobium sp. TaxID=3060597 RepID=UPI002727FBE6|nr:Rid family detoxifying hydrolase [Candidatus Oleimmundimicrobium sp.]MDO8886303.1 Rid family detoxifying hydrolase [Candidatus Oleimmundimicrobium sp.]
MPVAIITEEAPLPVGHYSQAMKAGDFIFVSGQIPLNPLNDDLIEGDIKIQTRLILRNIEAILVAGSSSISKVVKLTVYIRNFSDFSAVDSVFAEFFIGEPPAREVVGVNKLPKDAEIEISAIVLAN